jgi:protein TonB
MRQRLFSLGAAITFSVCIHIVAASILLGSPQQGAQDVGSGGIAVSLGPAGREPGGEKATEGTADTLKSEATANESAESANPAQPADTMPAETTEVPEASETEPPDVPILARASENMDDSSLENRVEESVDVVISSDAVEIEADTAVKPVEIAAVQPTAAKNLDAKRTVNVDPVKRKELQPAAVTAAESTVNPLSSPPIPKQKPRPPVEERIEARFHETASPVEKVSVAVNVTDGEERPQQSSSLMAGQGGRSGSSGRSETGSGDDTSGGGTPGAAADYFTQLQAWLEKHKRYPRRAKLRNEQGVALLRFFVTRAGEVTDFGIERSTGHLLLDEEVLEMIQRAQPLPKMPPEMRGSRVELLVPVQFFLR